VSNPANFASLKQFIKEERKTIVRAIDEAEAEEKKITPEEARTRRSRM